MRPTAIVLAIGLALALAGCGFGRMASYGLSYDSAIVEMGEARFKLAVHPRENTIMLQRVFVQASGQDSPTVIDRVVAKFLEPTSCRHGPVNSIASGTWEVDYNCPAGVDLRGLVRDQEALLMNGAPIRMGGTH